MKNQQRFDRPSQSLASTYPQPATPAASAPIARKTSPIPDGAMVLVKPEIRLSEWLMRDDGTQTKKLEPEIAYVWQGAIVIDELKLIIPLAGNFIKTKG